MKFAKLMKLPISKRKMICITLGIGAGFLCAYLASTSPNAAVDFWWSPLMWTIVFNRMLIGVFILIAGLMNYHPVFNMKFPAWLRGSVFGAFVSLDIAIPVFMSPNMAIDEMRMIFWMTIAAGAVYGLIIDVIATKVAGDGKELMEGIVV
jgi:hypothetical protein